jgi:NAD(P)H dehydrogenase (quinone)
MLIIYAHPNKEGHCGHFLKVLEDRLRGLGTEYHVLDLYAMKYNPVLQANEHYTSGRRDISEENRRIQELIRLTDRLVFIYPLWWQNMPAVLKGFIDRVFTRGFAFVYEGMMPKGLLKGKRAAVLVSMGAPKLLNWLVFRNWHDKVMTKAVLRFCGVKSKVFKVGQASRFNDRQKSKIEKEVDKALGYLDLK